MAHASSELLWTRAKRSEDGRACRDTNHSRTNSTINRVLTLEPPVVEQPKGAGSLLDYQLDAPIGLKLGNVLVTQLGLPFRTELRNKQTKRLGSV